MHLVITKIPIKDAVLIALGSNGSEHDFMIAQQPLGGALGYPAFDFTASSLDQSWPLPPNSQRVGRASPDPSFVMIIIARNPVSLIRFQIIKQQ